MKTIEINDNEPRTIRFGRIRPFRNICKVTGVQEWCNVEVEYVPDGRVVDIVDYRKFFERGFNELIENIASIVAGEIWESARPKYLKVTAYLEGNPHLSDWSCTIEKGEK